MPDVMPSKKRIVSAIFTLGVVGSVVLFFASLHLEKEVFKNTFIFSISGYAFVFSLMGILASTVRFPALRFLGVFFQTGCYFGALVGGTLLLMIWRSHLIIDYFVFACWYVFLTSYLLARTKILRSDRFVYGYLLGTCSLMLFIAEIAFSWVVKYDCGVSFLLSGWLFSLACLLYLKRIILTTVS